MKKNNEIQESVSNLADDARELLTATANVAETKVVEARKRLSAALERGKDCATAQARVADEVIRDHPYQSIGIAFGVGALLGLLLRRRA